MQTDGTAMQGREGTPFLRCIPPDSKCSLLVGEEMLQRPYHLQSTEFESINESLNWNLKRKCGLSLSKKKKKKGVD